VSSFREFLTPANVITSTNVLAGFLALLAVAGADMMLAAALVAVAAICDSVDGALARRQRGDGGFGANLDSLADLVSFGVVPAFALYLGPLHPHPVLGLAVCSGFLLAAAWRLARFPLVKRRDFFLGLPVPVTGILVMLIVVSEPRPALTLVAAVVASVLMLSTLPFPTLYGVGRATSTLLRGEVRRRLPDGESRSED
jgi:CDP-diacylglycerol---serine O-phosphatidyltransferase